MNEAIRRALTCLGTLATVVAITIATGGVPAQAATRFGCVYPRVCFYKTEPDWRAQRPTAAFRDYGLQSLGPASAHPYMVYNSRNDDGARLTRVFPSGVPAPAVCVLPGQNVANTDAVTINIMDSPNC